MIRFLIFFASIIFSSPAFSADGTEGREQDYDFWLSRFLSVSYPLKTISVTSRYGSRKDPFTGKKAFHNGIDLKARYDTVYAMFDGVVQDIGSDGRSGHYFRIRHGLYTISYCHLSRRFINAGDSVFAGMMIGVSGGTGRSTAPHLHLVVKKSDKLVNPDILLRFITRTRSEAMRYLGITDNVSTAFVSPDEFFTHYSLLAMDHQRRYGIPSSVTLSQMAHETNMGTHILCRKGKNFFGIKCTRQWLAQGRPFSCHDDDRKGEKFCNYSTVEESFEHHSRILMSKTYKECHKYKATDYHNWLMGIRRAGYATDPRYVRKCEYYIKRYNLHRYDLMA